MGRKYSLTLAGHRTSISLEDDFWTAFRACALREGLSVNALAQRIDAERVTAEGDLNLSSAIRLYVLRDLQARLRGTE